MTIHVFAGPSLSGSPVLELDGICAHPPIAHGDLFRLRLSPDDAVLIVDGVYQHTAPVRHKEILAVYATGVPIYGTASLGALRACEHLGHGMIGLGTVFGWYRDGRVFSDADVALTHGDADVDFHAFTHALVSILSVTDRLVLAGRLDSATASRIVETARSVHFSMRTNAALLAAAEMEEDADGLTASMRLVLDELDDDRLGDIKRIDAEAAIRYLLAQETLTPPDDDVTVPDTTYGREWRFQHTPATSDLNGPTRRQVLAYAQLFLPDYPDRHTKYVLNSLRPEHPAVGAGGLSPAWVDALTPEEWEHRGVLVGDEPATLNAHDRAIRVLVRTFRLRSGRLVYEDIPSGLLDDMPELIDQCARLLQMNEEAMRVNPLFHPGDIPPEMLDSTFAALWRTDKLPVHVLDRGFRSVADFREQARPFFIAARASVSTAAAANS